MSEVIENAEIISESEIVKKNEVQNMGDYLEKVMSADTTIQIKETPRVSARRKGNAELKIIANEDGENKFEDLIYLKSSMSISAFKLLEDAQVLKDETMDLEAVSGMIDIFPKFMMKITHKANFDFSIKEYESFDDLVKIAIFEILFAHYEKSGEMISKK